MPFSSDVWKWVLKHRLSKWVFISASELKSTPHKTHSLESKHTCSMEGILDIHLHNLLWALDCAFVTFSEVKVFNPKSVINFEFKLRHVWFPEIIFSIKSETSSSWKKVPSDARIFFRYPNLPNIEHHTQESLKWS